MRGGDFDIAAFAILWDLIAQEFWAF
ncbi:6c6fa146-6459-4516-88ae-cd8a0d92862b [Thermothielavioides terrestris]|uniref:6c6fa146-6459-4516-88ae-cd8a0d92862b n=1 Tax=Thermothielavioides terrestris TaxID=2587410 RepID=A0A446BYK1_9PEZI|nr:6c6fa146-6459-4516-88ae-cd8a0d92862b [Thermothielavioides terrestris]